MTEKFYKEGSADEMDEYINYDRHNLAKLKILSAVKTCQERGISAVASEIVKLTGKTPNQVNYCLYHYSELFPYLKRKYANKARWHPVPKTRAEKQKRRKRILGARKPKSMYKYTLATEGKNVLRKLLERYERGLDLNLRRKNPQPVVF